jgi:hypothetical protein
MAITRWRSTMTVILQWLHRDKPLPMLFSGRFLSTHPGKGSSIMLYDSDFQMPLFLFLLPFKFIASLLITILILTRLV